MAASPAATSRDILELTRERLEVGGLVAAVTEPACGAVASFLGSVRSPNHGKLVEYIDYQGYDAMAEAELRRIASELRARHELGRIAIVHRLGRLAPGEVSLAIVVASAHRGAALDACREALELVKARLPIWKYEVGPGEAGYVAGRTEAGPTL